MQKKLEDLHDMLARALKARKQSVAQLFKCFSSFIQDYDFSVVSLVLVCNSHIKKRLNQKTKPHFLGPMVVVHCMKGGAYILAKLNGAASKIRYAALKSFLTWQDSWTVYQSPLFG